MSGKIPLGMAFTSLAKHAQDNRISTDPFTHLSRYRQLMEREKNLDLAQVDQERAAAVAALARVLGQSDLKILTQKALRYRGGSFSPLEFHRLLSKMTEGHRLTYPALQAYTQYLEIAQGIDRKGLQKDMEAVTDLVFQKVSGSKGLPARAHRVAKLFRLAEKFMRLRASREDYLFFQKEMRGNGVAWLVSSVSVLSKQANVPVEIPLGQTDVLETGMQMAQAFYALALKRDGVLASNLVTQMKQTGKNRAIMLCGGFHAEGILEYLKAQGISYAVVLPNAGTESTEERYMALLLRKDTPYLAYAELDFEVGEAECQAHARAK